MKKILLISLLFACWCLMAQAMPAKPGWQTVTQSDGTTLKVQTVGNAFTGTILTSDGLAVERGKDGDFYYFSSLTGLSAVRAHEVGERSASETAFINVQRSNLKKEARPRYIPGKPNTFGVGGSNADSGVPAQGARHIPILLVEFKDKKFNNTREEVINAMLMGNRSVGQYFRDQSNGLYQPEFDVYGIYTLSQNREYYGGHSSGGDNDQRLGSFVTEACQMAAAEGVSFKPFDTNNDDYCDVVIVIYAGVGEAQASTTHPEAIWPCNWNLSSASYYGQGGNGAFRPKSGDPYINSFAVFNELHGSNDNTMIIDGIGTFAHEFGHCLGLPDFYDTGGGGHYGLGYWDIMCSGCYNDDTFTPAGYSAYEKNFMGWIDYITPVAGTYYTLPSWNQKNQATDKAVRIVSNLNQNEYFILENRKRQGWDSFLPSEGIMITHVTYDQQRWRYNTPNNQDIQLMTIMNADNSWSRDDESTDLWPQGSQTDFTDNSTPAARLNMKSSGSITGSAGYLGKPVTEMVINADGSASFWYMKGSASGQVLFVPDTLDFGNVKLGQAITLALPVHGNNLTQQVQFSTGIAGIFDMSSNTVSAANANNGTQIQVTFTPQELEEYETAMTVTCGNGLTKTVVLKGRGIVNGETPVMQPANEQFINLTKFRADWTDQTPAENVASYTLEVKAMPSFNMLESVDFSGVPDGLTDDGHLADVSSNYQTYLPSGWCCTSGMYAYGGNLILRGIIRTKSYELTGQDKVTVDLYACSYYQSYYGSSTIEVSTSVDHKTIVLGGDFETYSVVLDCAANDMVTIRVCENFMYLNAVQIYAGEQLDLRATEQGNATYRLITGITDKFYTVNDLEPAGTFVYKVKATYIDGTESPWSNLRQVTLFENGHEFQPGDVNHDNFVDINDVTTLIALVLGQNPDNCCPICADIYSDDLIDINDVTTLIDKVLGKN